MPLITSTPFNPPPDPQGLNPNDLRAGFTLSSDNLSVTEDGATGIVSMRGDVISQTSGKWYFEGSYSNDYVNGQAANQAIGVSSATTVWGSTVHFRSQHSSAAAHFVYTDEPGINDTIDLWRYESIHQFQGSTEVANGLSSVTQLYGRTIGVKLDLDAFTYEFIDPAMTFGPYSLPTGGGSPAEFYPCIVISFGTWTVNFGATSYVHGLPSGYSNWPFA